MQLSDICAAIVDCEHKTAPEGDGFAWSVGTKAMKNGRLALDAAKPVSAATYDRWTRRLRPVPGDLILAREAPVGDVIRVPDEPLICLGQRTVLIRPDERKVHPRFLHYWLLGPDVQGVMRAQTGGATVGHLNVEDIRKLDVTSMPTSAAHQAGAAELLGSIDDLIENNRRRVAVLEEMARAIYREWFVKFRYPGHESVPLVDSALGPIPEGWEVRPVADGARIVRGRSYKSSELVQSGGLPFINLKCIARGGGFRRDGLKRYSGAYKEDQLVGAGDLVLAVTDLTQGREVLARATMVPRLPEGRGVISLDVVRLVPRSDADRLWLFAVLGWSDFPDRLKEFANGSTVLHLSPTHIEQAKVLWAPEPLRSRLADAISPCIAQVDELADQSEVLTAMRDLLLPKLVTGQIDVSGLDLDAVLDEAVA